MLGRGGKGIWGWEEMEPPAREREMPPYHAWGTAWPRRAQEVLPAPLSGDPFGQTLVASEFATTGPATWR